MQFFKGDCMCGIVGYINKKENTQRILIDCLKKLEYRGYDSCGICLNLKNNFYIKKSLGEICNLEHKLSFNDISNCGIAHTRWATHGKVNLQNTHPIVGNKNKWCVVHNGIIENYEELKNQYLKDVQFFGETDTEIIPNLIEHFAFDKSIDNFSKAVKLLKGSYAICALNNDDEDTIYFARKNSPLYIAKNQDNCMISSDCICFNKKFKKYFILPDNCFGVITKNSLLVFDFFGNKLNLEEKQVDNFEFSSKNDFKYFAEKEINEIPKVLKNIYINYIKKSYFANIDKKMLKNIKKIKLIGCGSSYHSALMGVKYFEQTKLFCTAEIASEFRYSNEPIDKHTLYVFISQSGETADTLLCLQKVKNVGAKSLAIVNILHSTLARECDFALPMLAGPEIAVVSTKCYNATIFILKLLSLYINNKENYDCKTFNYPFQNFDFFKNDNLIDYVSDIVCLNEKIFFIGKNEDYVTSMEASLKLKEISYINCSSLPSGELKHGTLSLIDEKSLVFITISKQELLSKNLASASEIKSRNGKVIVVTNLDIESQYLKDVDFIFKFDACSEEFSSIVDIIFFQKLALKTCLKLGYNPDKPRNLAKSVTVE